MTGNFYNTEGHLDPSGPFARVSSILDVRKEQQIEDYKMRVVAEGGLEALVEDKAFYTSRGTLIHEAIKHYIDTGEEIVLPETMNHLGVEKPCKALFTGFKNWYEKTQPTDCSAEVFLFNDEHQYAGTCDLICMIDGEWWIVDFKTTKGHRPGHGLQLIAYQRAYFEQTGIWCRVGILRLEPKNKCGYSKLKEYDEDYRVFLAHLKVFRWQQSKLKGPLLDDEEPIEGMVEVLV